MFYLVHSLSVPELIQLIVLIILSLFVIAISRILLIPIVNCESMSELKKIRVGPRKTVYI